MDTLQGRFKVMKKLTVNIISCCEVISITITQEFIERVESLSKKYGIKYPLKFKYRKEGTIREVDDEHYDEKISIPGVSDDDEE